MPFLAYTSDWAMTPSERDISGLCESEVASVGLISLSHSSKLDTAKKISTGKPAPTPAGMTRRCEEENPS